MGEQYYRHTWVEVDLDAITHNVMEFRRHLSSATQIMAVVKADGYGHGAVPVAKAALDAGATYLGIALLDEAIQLREAGIEAPILILGYTPPEFVETAIQYNITMAVYHEDLISHIDKSAAKLGKKAKIHLKVDTGMGRIGVRSKEELDVLVARAYQCRSVYLEGVFTHFSCADDEDTEYTAKQHHNFIKAVQSYDIPIIHCSNSAAGILYPEWGYNMMRLGISLYGQYPSEYTMNKRIVLKPAFSLKSKISHLKSVPAGTAISYGATYVTQEESRIASVPIGYADGFSRSLSNRGYAIVGGKRVPIIGRVCMDQLMLDVTNIADCGIGDEVVFIGEQIEESISVDDMANLLQTINYEVTCMIDKRVPRVYVKSGEVVMTKNFLT
ncbi:MAG TPA: alanine racemase [Bacillota bacterium]|nr:alanine racemase [Bacillota bacterium]